MVYKWYILPIGGLYGTYHLLREPETTIEYWGFNPLILTNENRRGARDSGNPSGRSPPPTCGSLGGRDSLICRKGPFQPKKKQSGIKTTFSSFSSGFGGFKKIKMHLSYIKYKVLWGFYSIYTRVKVNGTLTMYWFPQNLHRTHLPKKGTWIRVLRLVAAIPDRCSTSGV